MRGGSTTILAAGKFIKYHFDRLTDLKFNMSYVNVMKCKFISPIVLGINTIKQNTCHSKPKFLPSFKKNTF